MCNKKLITRILFLSLVFLINSFVLTGKTAYAETESRKQDIIDLTGIMNNGTGGSVISKSYVTREEFAQMLVQASPYAGEVKSSNKTKLFKDVSSKSKKGVYVQIAVTKGYMSGYLGGEFKPTKSVTQKEAIYGILGLLGYTKEDFIGKLSDARYDKFIELGLNKNLSSDWSKHLTQKDCETLFYNLLVSKQKAGDVYAKSLGYTLNNNNEFDYTALLENKTKGPILAQTGWETNLNNKLSSYDILLNDKSATAADIEDNDIVYYADQAKKIWVYSEKVFGSVENITFAQGEPQDFTIAGTTYLVEKPANLKKVLKDSSIQKGTLVALLLGRDGKISQVLPIQSTLAKSNWQQQISFDPEKGTILINEAISTAKSLGSYEVLYYSNDLKRIWAFDKKVYGSLDTMTSSHGELQEVTVSGENYQLQDSKELKKEIKSSSLQTGMPVVLLLGWNDKVAKIIKLSGLVAEGDWEQKLTFNPKEGSIYKNGSKRTAADISNEDIVYYSNELKTLWVYGKKSYGVIDNIAPNTSAPESVVVAGKTYELKVLPLNSTGKLTSDPDGLVGNAWGSRIRDNGISEGSNVVLLFGYNSYVVDIRAAEKLPVTLVGYVTQIDNKVLKDEYQNSKVQQIIRITDTEGVERDFPCSDTTIIKGSIVEISFQNGKTTIMKVNAPSNIPTDINAKSIAVGARMLEVKDQKATKLSASKLKELSWTSSNILYYKLDSSDAITDLILNNVVGSFYQYGLLKKVTFPTEFEYSSTPTFTFDIAGTETILSADNVVWNINSGPKAILIEDNKIKNLIDLKAVKIALISGKQASTGDSVYRIADDALVYFYKKDIYYKGKLEDITNFDNKHVSGYVDQPKGPIRIIIVTE